MVRDKINVTIENNFIKEEMPSGIMSRGKSFQYIKHASLDEVIGIALAEDEGSRTVTYRYQETLKRLWVLRELTNDPDYRYIECFECAFSEKKSGWGFRGWGEEECIPYDNCPLDLISIATMGMKQVWRRESMLAEGERESIPLGAWLHSTSGVKLPSGELCYDFQFVRPGVYRSPNGKEWKLSKSVISRTLLEGFGVAGGRA